MRVDRYPWGGLVVDRTAGSRAYLIRLRSHPWHPELVAGFGVRLLGWHFAVHSWR